MNADALIESDNTTGLDQKTIDARAKLLAFRNALGGPADARRQRQRHGRRPVRGGLVPDRDARGARRHRSTGSPVTSVKWPLATSLATFGEPLAAGMVERCGVVERCGCRRRSTPLFEKANAETHWSSGGKSYYLRVRPLLPDESGCTDPIG